MKNTRTLRFLALSLAAGCLLGGCAIAPTYEYNANNGAGYYTGKSPYGNADTVIEGGVYAAPGWNGWWGPGWGWGYPSGWYGYGGISVGTMLIF